MANAKIKKKHFAQFMEKKEIKYQERNILQIIREVKSKHSFERFYVELNRNSRAKM